MSDFLALSTGCVGSGVVSTLNLTHLEALIRSSTEKPRKQQGPDIRLHASRLKYIIELKGGVLSIIRLDINACASIAVIFTWDLGLAVASECLLSTFTRHFDFSLPTHLRLRKREKFDFASDPRPPRPPRSQSPGIACSQEPRGTHPLSMTGLAIPAI